jgi:KUP system potassium uptake protein
MTASAPTVPRTGAPALALGALGIVYGDLGTSPLYTMQTVLGSLGRLSPAESALGMLSLIFWTLIITISLKYCLIVMRADNHGEGGIMALMSLVGLNDWRRGIYLGASLGLLGAALIYGDGVITPAISVLSAIEGVNLAIPALKPYVTVIAVVILAALFASQRFGTAKLGSAFGPVMLTWFAVIGLLGLASVLRHPVVLEAVNPLHGVRLLMHAGPTALLILGGVFLCATGGEALYADMGHFGRFPIQLAWYSVVLPCLLLSYAGQTGLVLDGAVPKGANPFFLLAPKWAVIPLVVLATLATIIASQAIITGSFSMTRQAFQLGWMPGFNIIQTSKRVYGQIYVPGVNFMMAVLTIAITLAFGSSVRLAGAYGTAVATTMVITTLLLIRAMIRVWRWPPALILPVAGLFLAVDLSFFAANLPKIVEGGWAPLTLGVYIFFIMVTWRTGNRRLQGKLVSEPAAQFLEEVSQKKVPRIPGTVVYLTPTTESVPSYVSDYVRNIGSLHESIVALNIHFEEEPQVTDKRYEIQPVAESMSRVTLHYGFDETPDIPAALKQIEKNLPPRTDADHAVFFVARDAVSIGRHGLWERARLNLYAFLSRNAARALDRFNLPIGRTIELDRRVVL